MKSVSLPVIAKEELLKRTTSRCLVCHASCPAEVWRVTGSPQKVFLKRTCATHGEASVCIASDARFYWLAQGKSENACCSISSCCSPQPSVPTSAELLKNMVFSAADYSVAGTLGQNANGKGD